MSGSPSVCSYAVEVAPVFLLTDRELLDLRHYGHGHYKVANPIAEASTFIRSISGLHGICDPSLHVEGLAGILFGSPQVVSSGSRRRGVSWLRVPGRQSLLLV